MAKKQGEGGQEKNAHGEWCNDADDGNADSTHIRFFRRTGRLRAIEKSASIPSSR